MSAFDGARLPSVYDAPGPRAHRGLGMAVVVLSCVFGALVIINALVSIPVAHEVAGGDRLEDVPLVYLGLYSLTAFGIVPLAIAVLVVTAIWMIKAQDNARILRPRWHHRLARPWAVWGWIMPIVSLFVPVRFISDLHDSSDHESRGLVGWWWTTWLVTILLQRVQARVLSGLDPGRPARGVDLASVLLVLTTGTALALWIRIVRRIADGQQRQVDEYWSRATTPPAR